LSIEQLRALDPDALHLIVFGPGFGESILVRLPPAAWLVVDSLRQRDNATEAIPALRVLDLHESRASAIVLTHPHLDHSDGLPAVLDRRNENAPVGCLAAHFDPPERWRGNPDSEVELSGSATEAALQRIFDIWERDPGARWDLTTGTEQALGNGRATVIHPPADRAAQLARASDPNRASSPLLIEWEGPPVLLGADLPSVEWRRVPATFAGSGSLVATPILKVSHHCSGKAQHELVIGLPPRKSRACVATPWNKGSKGRRLPRFDDGEGVQVLLETVNELFLSSMPTPYDLARGNRITRATANSSRHQQRVGGEVVLDVDPPVPSVADSWVHIALSADGSVAVELGAAAVVVTR
jgi:hypothetical protein